MVELSWRENPGRMNCGHWWGRGHGERRVWTSVERDVSLLKNIHSIGAQTNYHMHYLIFLNDLCDMVRVFAVLFLFLSLPLFRSLSLSMPLVPPSLPLSLFMLLMICLLFCLSISFSLSCLPYISRSLNLYLSLYSYLSRSICLSLSLSLSLSTQLYLCVSLYKYIYIDMYVYRYMKAHGPTTCSWVDIHARLCQCLCQQLWNHPSINKSQLELQWVGWSESLPFPNGLTKQCIKQRA